MADCRLDFKLEFSSGFILLETGDNILLETGDLLEIESIPCPRLDLGLSCRIGGNIR